MGEDACVFELKKEPKAGRYVSLSALGCFGFWFFDYVVRGWLGGTPNLAVSLRHTFIIAVCLSFVVGFVLRDGTRRLTLSREGLALESAGGRGIRMGWHEIESVKPERGSLVCGTGARTLAIPLSMASRQDFIDCLTSLAGPDHPLTKAARKI